MSEQVCQHHGSHDVLINRLCEDVSDLIEKSGNQTLAIHDLRESDKELRKATDEFYERLKNRDKELSVLQELVYGVKDLGSKMETVMSIVETHTSEIAKIKGKPGEIALSLWKIILTTGLTASIGIYVGTLLGK